MLTIEKLREISKEIIPNEAAKMVLTAIATVEQRIILERIVEQLERIAGAIEEHEQIDDKPFAKRIGVPSLESLDQAFIEIKK